MSIRKLSVHKSANCKVIIDDAENRIDFISYATRVISIIFKDDCRLIECTGTYSQTTRKQIGYFLKEYANDLCYYDMKNIVGKGFTAC